MSTSTGAPAAFARSDGSMLATNGTAVAAVGDSSGDAGGGDQKAPLALIQLLVGHVNIPCRWKRGILHKHCAKVKQNVKKHLSDHAFMRSFARFAAARSGGVACNITASGTLISSAPR